MEIEDGGEMGRQISHPELQQEKTWARFNLERKKNKEKKKPRAGLPSRGRREAASGAVGRLMGQAKRSPGQGRCCPKSPGAGGDAKGTQRPSAVESPPHPSPPASWAEPGRAEGKEGDAPLGVY